MKRSVVYYPNKSHENMIINYSVLIKTQETYCNKFYIFERKKERKKRNGSILKIKYMKMKEAMAMAMQLVSLAAT